AVPAKRSRCFKRRRAANSICRTIVLPRCAHTRAGAGSARRSSPSSSLPRSRPATSSMPFWMTRSHSAPFSLSAATGETSTMHDNGVNESVNESVLAHLNEHHSMKNENTLLRQHVAALERDLSNERAAKEALQQALNDSSQRSEWYAREYARLRTSLRN